MKIERPKIIQAVREAAKGRCERCHFSRPLDVHHWHIKTGMGGGSRLDVSLNLIAVCRECHGLDGTKQADFLRANCAEIVSRREVISYEVIDDILRLLWRSPKAATMEWFADHAKDWPESARVLLAKTLAEAGIEREE